MRRVLLLLSPLLFAATVANAQSGEIRRADAFYEAGGYYEAIPLYKKGLETIPQAQMGEYLFRLAECYRHTGNARQAELWYSKAITRDCAQPRIHLYYAQMLLQTEKYDLARVEFETHKELMPNDPLADNGLQSIDLAIAWTASPSGYIVKHVPALNSKFDDYAPMFGSKDYRTMLLTSSRDNALGKTTHAATGGKLTDIFVTLSNGEGRWSTPALLSGEINQASAEEGTPAFNPDYTTMYFTRCRLNTKKGKLGCQIYQAPQTGQGWDNAELIPIAHDSVVVAHPSISADELTLYFTAELPGGFGGMDIWKITRASRTDAWGEPVNLGGTINTPGNECFPYIHPDGTLYFSSDGHPGMGGLDIFRAKQQAGGNGWEIENMRYPINSPADDFGITFQREREEGFFSSRRPGGRGGDDIYWFRLPPLEFHLEGNLMAEDGDKPLTNADIRLVGSDGSIQEIKTDAQGNYRTMLNANTDYVIIPRTKGYLSSRDKITTKGKTASETIRRTMRLTAKTATITLPNIFYDFDSWELKPESIESLEQLVVILNDNPTVVIELGAHTDGTGEYDYNMGLSQKRAQSVVNFLVERKIPTARLRAKGYAQTQPVVVTPELNQAHPFLPVGQPLTMEFIGKLADDAQREAAHAANRRTTFRVLRDDYKPTGN